MRLPALPLAVVFALLASGAAAQDVQNVSTEVRRNKVPAASRIDTGRFSTETAVDRTVPRNRPENPSPFRWLNPDSEPNSLLSGGLLEQTRIRPGARWPGINFTGWTPADPTLAVGPGHVVVTVNSQIAFYNKAGAQSFNQSAQTFFAGMGAGTFLFDPKVVYDRLAQRFVMVFLEEDDNTQTSKVLLAVSDDSDPNGTWYRYRLEAKMIVNGNPMWLDYPGLGYNKDAYVISGNLFPIATGGFSGTEFVVVPKVPALSGQALTSLQLRDGSSGSVQMTDVFDPTLNAIYGISTQNTSTLRVHRLINLDTATPTISTASVAVPTFSNPSVDAPSTPGLLDAMDGRILDAGWRAGRITATHTVDSTGDTTNRVRWYQVNVSAFPTVALVQSGTVMPSGGPHYHMGGIAVNAAGDIGLVFTRSASSGEGAPADFMATSRLNGDPLGTMGAPVLLQSSTAATYGGTGSNRWGDYFKAVVDPADEATFWGIGMISNSSARWQTVVQSWQVAAPVTVVAVSLTSGEVAGGGVLAGTVNLSGPAPAGGLTVSLSSTDPSAQVPPTILIPGGSSSGNFTVTTSPIPPPDRNLSIIASANSSSASAPLTVKWQTADLAPQSHTIVRGQFVSGTLADALASDDQRFVVQRGSVLSSSEAPINLEFAFTAPTIAPSAMTVTLEAQVNTPGLTQYLEIYDWISLGWVSLDERPGSFGVDGIAVGTPSPPYRFIDAVTGTIRARVRARATSATLGSRLEMRVDQIAISLVR